MAYLFGIRPDEFWEMIPREFYKFIDMQIEKQDREQEFEQRNTALICATIANFSLTKRKGKHYKIDDFIPKEKEETKQMTEKQMLKKVIQINKYLGGEDLRTKEGE